MTKQIPNIDRERSFAEGEYLIHVSGVIGKATGEVIYEPRNPVEKTRIILRNGLPLLDYSMKFCVASETDGNEQTLELIITGLNRPPPQ